MRRQLVVVALVALLAACATTRQPQFNVTVDSLAALTAQEKRTYILLPGNEGVTWDDLQFQEYAAYLLRVLNAQGFVSTEKAEDADVAIVLSYGIGDPQTRQYSSSLPVWGQTGVASSQTYGTATSYGNSASYSGTTTYTPTYGVTGHTSQIGTQTTYFRYALITGYDFKAFRESKKQGQLWKTTITSSGSSGDLRQVFPILIGAAVPYLATNTGKQVPVKLYENDEIVRSVKGDAVEKQ